jgi:thioesterase domain-containing protein
MIDHGAVVNTILDVNARFGVIEQDRVLALSSLGFDLSVWDIFGVLAAGGALVIPGPSDRLDPARWATLCRQHGVTLWNTVPKLMEMLVEHLEDSAAQLPAQLRVVMMSGDWIPVALPDRIRTASAVAPKIVSFGGATEASIWSICYPIDVVDPAWPSIPYGKAMRNQTMHVLDPALCERESWVRGEIFIGGQGLARGYWREPDKTAARFVAHPGGTGRLYRTGDLGRYLPDGNIELLGREDSEVKVRGYRIELGEIEAVLNGHAAVRTSCITVRNVVGGQAVGADKQIVAYVVPKDGEAPSPSALRAYLEALLPVYMVPSHVVLIRSIPLSPNGKVDRQALPAPEQPAPSREEVQPPRDEVERRIAAIWRDLLQVSTIGVHDNFFALGGDSVLAIRMLARVRRETGVELGAAALFDGGLAGPSIETLGRRVSAGNAVAAMALVPIQPNGDRCPLFAVHAVGGTVLSYAKLALLLPPDQPLYGLQSVERPSDAPENLSAMAARYVEAIRRLQPLGPYRLGGWSLGGLIAFEMARQLAAAGQSIERLILIDSFAPGPGAEDERPPPATRDLVAWFARDVCGRFDADVVGDAPAADESTELQLMYGRLRRRDLLPGDLPERDFVRLYASYKQNAYAGRGYQGGAYRGSITLVCAETPPPPSFRDHPALRGPEIDDPDLGWGPFVAGTIDRYLVPGDHYAIVQQPGIERLAAQLSAVLRLADAR